MTVATEYSASSLQLPRTSCRGPPPIHLCSAADAGRGCSRRRIYFCMHTRITSSKPSFPLDAAPTSAPRGWLRTCTPVYKRTASLCTTHTAACIAGVVWARCGLCAASHKLSARLPPPVVAKASRHAPSPSQPTRSHRGRAPAPSAAGALALDVTLPLRPSPRSMPRRSPADVGPAIHDSIHLNLA